MSPSDPENLPPKVPWFVRSLPIFGPYLETEWAVIRAAPHTSALVAVTAGVLAVFTTLWFEERHYAERFAIFQQSEQDLTSQRDYYSRQLDDYRRAFPGKSPDDAVKEVAALRADLENTTKHLDALEKAVSLANKQNQYEIAGLTTQLQETQKLASQHQFWHLSDDEKYRLGKVLDEFPKQQRFTFAIQSAFANAQAATMTDDLVTVFQAHSWQVTASQNLTLRADLVGINFVVALDFPRRDKDMPPHAAELAEIFTKAGIKYGGGWVPGFDNNSLVLAIGSRPPDW
jgi:hypothetical protein